jgi:hypothetical protein
VCVAIRIKPFSDIATVMNYGKKVATRKSMYKWYKSFAETGCICAKKKNKNK